MSLATPAVADDFPYFPAWYGRLPTFEHLRFESTHSKKSKISCKEYLFNLKALLDSRYYFHWMYSDASSYGVMAYKEAWADYQACRAVQKEPDGVKRAELMQGWFKEKHFGGKGRNRVNEVWAYRDVPQGVGRWS